MRNKCTTLRTSLILTGLLACVLPSLAQPVHHEWSKGTGGPRTDGGYATTVDSRGNVYTTGSFVGTVDFDPGPGLFYLVTTGGNYDNNLFVSKLDAAGNFVWAKHFIGAGAGTGGGGNAIKVDTAGNVYITGLFWGTVDFDPGAGTYNLTATGGYDIFVVKLDSSGALTWAKQMDGTGDEQGNAIGVDAAGNVYIAGWFKDMVDFDPGPASHTLSATGTAADIFISKLNAAGNFVWAQRIGDNYRDEGLGLSLDAEANIYVTGIFSQTVDFNPGTGPADMFNLTANGTSGAFICKLDSAGNFRWASGFSGISAQVLGSAITLDTANNVYITGYFVGTVDFNPGTGVSELVSASADRDVFIARLDAAGNFAWARRIGSTGRDEGTSIALDRSGNVYTTGYFNSTVDFDPGADSAKLGSAGLWDIFISKLNHAGNYVWAHTVGGSSYDQGYSIAVDAQQTIYLTGLFSGTVDFNPGPDTANLVSKGNEDIFVLKWDQCNNTAPVIAERACGSYTLDGQTYTASGTYTQVIYAGCDTSNVTLHLTIDTVTAAISVNGVELSSTYSYDHYQWLRNDTAIPGATNRNYIVTVNAGYKLVAANANGCADTSDIYMVNNVAIAGGSDLAQSVQVYPNPVLDIVYIQSPVAINAILTSIEGKIYRVQTHAAAVPVGDLPPGVYLLRITGSDGRLIKVEKLVKQIH